MLQAEHPASPSLRELAPSPSHCVHLRLARLLARVTMWRVTIPLYKAVRHRVTLAAYTATLPYSMRSRHMLAQCLVVAVGQMNLGIATQGPDGTSYGWDPGTHPCWRRGCEGTAKHRACA